MSAIQNKAQELLMAAPQDFEVCFSPQGHCDVKFWKYLDTAQHSVDMAIYDITHPKIVHELLVLSEKKVAVRILADRRQAQGEHSLVSTLVKAGIPVRYGYQRGIMHNKFTIVDGKWVETGSYNYTINASYNNNENQIYLANAGVVAKYASRFENLWQEGTPVKLRGVSSQDR